MIKKLLLVLCVIGFTAAHANQFLYVTSLHNTPYPVTVCDLDPSTGAVATCGDSGFPVPATRPGQITFQTIGTQNFAYVTTYEGPVYQCTVDNTTGLLSRCATTASISGTNIIGIEFFTTHVGNIYAFLGDGHQNGQVWQCPVDGTTGALGVCVTANSQQFANGLMFFDSYKFGTKTSLYLPDGNYGNVGQHAWRCAINQVTGTIPSSCPDSGAGAVFTGPVSMTLNTTTLGDTFAYVSSYLVTELTRCATDSNGKLNNCNSFAAFYDSSYNNAVQFEHPEQTAFFNTTSGDYFYMADGVTGLITQCTVNPNLPYPGSLINCNQTSAGFSRPFGVTVWP